MTTRRILLAALATATLIAPAAQADPPDMHASTALAAAKARPQAQPPDMHASTAEAAASQGGGESGQPPAARPAVPATPGAPPTDDGSPVPVIPIVAGVLGVLVAALTVHYGSRRPTLLVSALRRHSSNP